MAKKWYHLSRLQKLYIQTILTLLFFVLEAVVGYMFHSVSLIADSFHMLSDLLGLGVAIYAIRLAQRTTFSPQLSFGFQRAEVLGALINAVFLLALCFTIYMEALQRFFQPNPVTDPKMVLIVGAAGAFVNITGVLMFGGHHHDHPDEPKPLSPQEEQQLVKHVFEETASRSNLDILSTASKDSASELYQSKRKSSMVTLDINDEFERSPQRHRADSTASSASSRVLGKPADGGHMNMHGVFLHMLGDLLGSITVIISALVMWLATSWQDRWIVDPIVSIIITTAIVSFTFPLARTSARVLLQATPGHISHSVVKRALLLVPGVEGVHELHIWQLSDTKTVASVHVRLSPVVDALKTIRAVKEIMCGFGVCAVTVQPEQISLDHDEGDKQDACTLHGGDVGCLARCTRESCEPNQCCSIDRVRADNDERVTYGGFWFGIGPARSVMDRARRDSRRASARGFINGISPQAQARLSQASIYGGPASGMRRRSSALLDSEKQGERRRSVQFRDAAS